MEYFSSVWDQHTQQNSNKLKVVQHSLRATRAVLKDHDRTSSVTSMLQQLKWNKLLERWAKASAALFFKIIKGLVSVPSQPYLVPIICDTRGHNVKYYIPITRTVVYQNSLFPASIKLLNNLPLTVVSSPNNDNFHCLLAQAQLPYA